MLQAIDLVKHFPVRGSGGADGAVVQALNGVSLSVARGETLGIVGESGCGKSTLAELLVRLQQPTSGRVILDASTSPRFVAQSCAGSGGRSSWSSRTRTPRCRRGRPSAGR